MWLADRKNIRGRNKLRLWCDRHQAMGFGKELPIKSVFGEWPFARKEQQPTDSESCAALRVTLKRRKLGFLRHPSVTLPNPASFASDLLEPEVLTGLVSHHNEGRPKCGLIRSTF